MGTRAGSSFTEAVVAGSHDRERRWGLCFSGAMISDNYNNYCNLLLMYAKSLKFQYLLYFN